jgi:hypothetical protein
MVFGVFEAEIARSTSWLDADPIADPHQDVVDPHVVPTKHGQSVRRPAQPSRDLAHADALGEVGGSKDAFSNAGM